MKYFLAGGEVYSPNGFYLQDLLIEDGRIHFINDSLNVPDDSITLDITGKVVFPSFVDMHVHLREPGFAYKETILSGTEAGAAGGFTTLCSMPNLNPAPDSLPNLETQLEIIRQSAVTNVLPFATITRGRQGKELVDYEAMAPFVAGFSDDGSGVQDPGIMREAMAEIARTGKILAAHCEVEALINGGYIHDGEYARRNNHRGISSESEWREVERDILISADTGCRLHICHISSKESVNLVREAKKDGLPVTCETGPHYLTFSDADLKEEGRFKMNPPIRDKSDRDALREALIDGTIDVIATDHAPHSAEEKSKGLRGSAMGVVGLETAFPAVLTTMVKSGLMPLSRLVEVMSTIPREILTLPPCDVKEGLGADITVASLNDVAPVNPHLFKSLGRATPYEGMILDGKIYLTFLNGKLIYQRNER